MDIDALKRISDSMPKIDLSKFYTPEQFYPKIEPPPIIDFDPEDTIVGDIKRKIEEQNKLVSQQIGILSEQNNLLAENYNKLKEMYDAQSESYKSAQEDLQRSRNYNIKMMIIAIIAMLAAIAGPIVTLIVSK